MNIEEQEERLNHLAGHYPMARPNHYDVKLYILRDDPNTVLVTVSGRPAANFELDKDNILDADWATISFDMIIWMIEESIFRPDSLEEIIKRLKKKALRFVKPNNYIKPFLTPLQELEI